MERSSQIKEKENYPVTLISYMDNWKVATSSCGDFTSPYAYDLISMSLPLFTDLDISFE